MSEVTDLVVIEKSNAMAVFTSSEQLDPLIAAIESEARSLVPDVTTKKGRDAIASMAHKVARSKTYIDNAGKDLVAELKALPKQIDESRRLVRERLDALKDEVRRPLTEWEAEQERIRQEEESKRAAEELAKKVEADHEMALLMNDALDREREEARKEAERQRIAHEEELKRQAAEKAKADADREAQRKIDEAAAREREATLAKERAEREAKEAAELAERNRIAAEQKAERDKQEAIAETQRKAQAEADRIKREADEKERARLAEEKRIADEAAARAADIEHRRTINRQSVAELVAAGLPEDCAQKCVAAIAKGEVKAICITY